MKYYKHLSEPWFTLVQNRIKVCEGRLNKGEFEKMAVGDQIQFENNDDGIFRKFTVTISKKNNYVSFQEYLEVETLTDCLPSINTIEKGVKIYRDFYSESDEKKYGIVALRFV